MATNNVQQKLACAVTLVTMLLLGACGGEAPTSSVDHAFVGSYTLQAINGSRLPYVILQSGQNSISVTEDHLTISDGGSWSETVILRTISNGVASNQTSAVAGTWLRSGNSLTLVNGQTNTTSYAGTFSDRQLDLISGSATFLFTR